MHKAELTLRNEKTEVSGLLILKMDLLGKPGLGFVKGFKFGTEKIPSTFYA